MDRQQLGILGQAHAVTHLKALGYRLLAQNWRCTLGEIDIVAEHDGDLVIIEVRTRRGLNALDQALESITPTKQKRLFDLATLYRADHPIDAPGIRIDVVV